MNVCNSNQWPRCRRKHRAFHLRVDKLMARMAQNKIRKDWMNLFIIQKRAIQQIAAQHHQMDQMVNHLHLKNFNLKQHLTVPQALKTKLLIMELIVLNSTQLLLNLLARLLIRAILILWWTQLHVKQLTWKARKWTSAVCKTYPFKKSKSLSQRKLNFKLA